MTHNQKRTQWYKEGAIGLGVGVLYGVTCTCVGHPFDTVKTKMQAQAGFESGGMIRAFAQTFKKEGVIGLYRGCIPPLWGSGIFRSVQFATFEAVYTFLDNKVGRSELPLTGGLQVRVICGGIVASTCRAVVECPLEYAKVRRQTGQTWTVRKLYTGFGITWCRTLGLMTSYFIFLDSGRRHFGGVFERPLLGPFLASGVAATLAWWIIWPLEYMKSQVQGGYGKEQSVIKRMKGIIQERGSYRALYRGLAPGSVRSFLANGVSMIVMTFAQKKVTDWGIRS